MGKPTGFIEIERDTGPVRPPRERVGDWGEFHPRCPDELLQDQGARCMDCGIPFCHVGEDIDGEAIGCPIGNLIPEWNDLVYQGLWREAYERLAKTNNFPEFTGRVCPAPCENSCVLGINQPPVSIKSIEAAVIDRAFENGWVRSEAPPLRTGRTVAIVGSGPAGLACAAQLNKVGHSVTVFERDDRVGGLLTYGIPNMKLDKRIVQRRIDLMASEGIQFRTGVRVGVDLSGRELLEKYDAVVLCTGATRPRDLPVEGRKLGGIHFAMEYLTEATRKLLAGGEPREPLSARGKDVVVIGGGDTGTDCVATALRQQCRSLIQLEILPRPPDERAPDNPWPQWARVFRVDYGQEEARELFGQDPRAFAVMTRRFMGDAVGFVQGLEIAEVTWERAGGSPAIQEIPGTVRSIPAQMVLLAMGFLGPENQLPDQLGLEIDGRSNIRADFGKYATNLASVFAAGDARRGQSLVVWAIREGREAAREVDGFLSGSSSLP